MPEELSPEVQKLIKDYQDWHSKLHLEENQPTIHVDDVASKVAALYEKIRGIVDWKEEHLMRRTAIERALKRRLISELPGLGIISNLKASKIAEPLVLELVRGGHFQNDKIPRKKIAAVQRALEKYIYILERSPFSKNSSSSVKNKVQFYNWILEIAACEIEEILSPSLRENALIELMTNLMEKKIAIAPEINIDENEKRTQIYIAVHQTLFRLDAPIISYHLLKCRYPQWADLTPETLNEITRDILAIWEGIEKDLSHPLSNEFLKICEKYDTPYLLLGDILDFFAENPAELPEKLSKPEVLTNLIRKAYDKRLSTLKSRLFRAAIYSTLSILISSGFSLFVVEVPLAKLFYGRFNLVAIIVDILGPTLLMFLLVATAKPPGKSNLEEVTREITKIVYQNQERGVYEIRAPKKRGFVANFIISFSYLSGLLLSLGLIIWAFRAAKIPPTSVVLDTMNVAVIVFAALLLRRRAKELTVEEEKINLLEFLLDTLSIPMAKLGQWLSAKWREYNIVSVFFTALVDMPFLTFVEFVEGWNLFLKEKKAEIR